MSHFSFELIFFFIILEILCLNIIDDDQDGFALAYHLVEGSQSWYYNIKVFLILN